MNCGMCADMQADDEPEPTSLVDESKPRKGLTLAEALAARDGTGRVTFDVTAPPGKLGVVFTPHAKDYTTVGMVKDTSPLLGKINVGDLVISVDGEDTSTHSYEELVDHLKQKEGS